MFQPLNPTLYRALEREFGAVEVSDPGARYVPNRQQSSYRRGRFETPPAVPGEYYKVRCPYCCDHSPRLYINHMFGVVDADRDDHLYLAHCFNENCIDSRDVQKELYDRLYPFNYGRRTKEAELLPSVQVQTPLVAVPQQVQAQLPSPLLPLSDPASVTAVDYLHRRGLNPLHLAERWGLSFCPRSWQPKPEIESRLVIPIYSVTQDFDSVSPIVSLAGWQARSLTDHTEEIRYLTMAGMKKSQILYGLPQAINTTGIVIVCEGPTDVWRLNCNAVACLGKSISQSQVQLLISHCPNRPVVVFFDRDADEDAQRVASQIRAAQRVWCRRDRVTTAHLPDGRDDVGECTWEEAWHSVHRVSTGLLF